MLASRPAGNGWTWIADAWTLFMRAPLPWMLIGVIYIVLSIVLAAIPVIGTLGGAVLVPVFVGGIMLGCRELHEGRSLKVSSLFAGFSTQTGALLAVGGITLAALLLSSLVVGFSVGRSLLPLIGTEPDPAAIAAVAGTLLLALLIFSALMLPVAMALWFAPPLVVFQGKGALQAMGLSFVACLKNMLPFLIYGIVLIVLSVLASIPAGLGWFVLLPVLFASVYTAYRDIFAS